MSLISVILVVYPSQIIKLFTDDVNVLKIAVPIMVVVATYQIFDGLQTVMGGVLKGFKMTKFVSGAVLAGYWFIGAPVAILCVGMNHMSLKGYWVALAISLFVMGVVQSVMARYKYKQIKEMYTNL